MTVQSIGTAVQVGNVTGNHLLMPAGEVAFGEVNFVGELDDLPQEIGPRAKTFDYARHLGSA